MATVTDLHGGTARAHGARRSADKERVGWRQARLWSPLHLARVPKALVQMGQMMPQLAKQMGQNGRMAKAQQV